MSGHKGNRFNGKVLSIEDTVKQISSWQSETTPPIEFQEEHALETPTSELHELFLNIKTNISHLFDLAVLFRREQSRELIRYRHMESQYADVGPDVAYVKDKFPKLKQAPWLAQRIGRWTADQRERIRYQHAHRKPITHQGDTERGRQIPESPEPDTQPVQLDTTPSMTSMNRDRQSPPDPAGATTNAPTESTSIFTSTNVFGDGKTRSTRSSATSFATTAESTVGSGRSIPNLESMCLDGNRLKYGAVFVCPYCQTSQKFETQRQWKYDILLSSFALAAVELTVPRHHVYSDLRPYSCTFENCLTSPFSSSLKWFEHEMSVHRRQWLCYLCDASHTSSTALHSHIASKHNAVTPAQRSALAQAGEQAWTTFSEATCLFCDQWNEISADARNRHTFSSHLGKHLRELAREAIPLAMDGLDVDGPNFKGKALEESAVRQSLEAPSRSDAVADSPPKQPTAATGPSADPRETSEQLSMRRATSIELHRHLESSEHLTSQIAHSESKSSQPPSVTPPALGVTTGTTEIATGLISTDPFTDELLRPPPTLDMATMFYTLNPSAHSSMADQGTLRDKIFGMIEANADGKEFVPADAIESLSPRDVVEAELVGKTGDAPLDLLLDYVLNKPAIKIFLTLTFRGRANAITHFYSIGVCDADLPIDLDQPPYSTLPKQSHAALTPPMTSQRSFTSPRSWGKAHCYDFTRDQWLFLAPVFTKEQFTYRLHKQCPLPITGTGTPFSPHSGLSGSVSEIEIHPAHQKVLKKVRSRHHSPQTWSGKLS